VNVQGAHHLSVVPLIQRLCLDFFNRTWKAYLNLFLLPNSTTISFFHPVRILISTLNQTRNKEQGTRNKEHFSQILLQTHSLFCFFFFFVFFCQVTLQSLLEKLPQENQSILLRLLQLFKKIKSKLQPHQYEQAAKLFRPYFMKFSVFNDPGNFRDSLVATSLIQYMIEDPDSFLSSVTSVYYLFLFNYLCFIKSFIYNFWFWFFV
jgi:hypothetical protein